MSTKTIMIQGTGSSVGKSVIVAALCRIFLQDGFRVAPFKAQNMSLNSFVTKEGGEMGRAQVVQAQAARIEPHTDMNPILIKPTSDVGAQIIIQGKPIADMSAREYINLKKEALGSVLDSFNRLKREYEVIVIEGAGSPAEINLKSHDIVNMKIAEIFNAPVILVGDIDKGGVFASLVGTLELLNKKECSRIEGFIINKFRGDKSLLKNGISFLKKRTKKKVLGVIPYFKDIRIPEEDGVVLEHEREDPRYRTDFLKKNVSDKVNIAVVKFPHISNFTDFDALEDEIDVRLSYIDRGHELNNIDVIILPGTKNTIQDLVWLKRIGLEKEILSTTNHKLSRTLIGICGGYQMLGKVIYNFHKIESTHREIQGLGLLPIATYFRPEKILCQTEATYIKTGLKVKGYQIHHGKTVALKPSRPVFKIDSGPKAATDGVREKNHFDGTWFDNGRIWGTYLHGIFDNHTFRRYFLNSIRLIKGLKALSIEKDVFNLEDEFDKLAGLIRKNIDMKLVYKIMNSRL